MNLSRRRKTIIWTLILVSLSLLGAGAQRNGQPNPAKVAATEPGYYQVTEVYDGDTIEVLIAGRQEKVRFIGVDTPETHDPRKPVQCFGQAASAKTKELLVGKSVRLEADPADSDRDKYFRLLRYVYLPDGTLLNRQLIADGYGFAYTVFPYAKLSEFQDLEQEAREQGKGLWSACRITQSGQVRQTEP
ncbi:MAG TPA: thermonuclease family protein [Candidatus Dormibacteraeota bacterium]|nr:thermonuclease family protein [Candidatus Dormibacteraeota bacterium]